MKKMISFFFADKSGTLVFGQMPNLPIIIWGVFTIISRLADGDASSVTGWIAKIGLIVWAVLEIYSGVNIFRRLLGLVVLCFTIYGLIS